MKKLFTFAAGAFLMFATSAMALPLPVLQPGYSWTNAPFWTNTDTTTPPDKGNSQFELIFENEGLSESDFGLFSVTGSSADPASVATKFQIFAYSDEPSANAFENKRTVLFQADGSVSIDGVNYTPFSKMFGFYYDVHMNDSAVVDHSYYTYTPFNADSETNHILTAFNQESHEILIYLDATNVNADPSFAGVFSEMTISGNDIAPVPEPGTLLLLGSGLIGLAFLKRRKQA